MKLIQDYKINNLCIKITKYRNDKNQICFRIYDEVKKKTLVIINCSYSELMLAINLM